MPYLVACLALGVLLLLDRFPADKASVVWKVTGAATIFVSIVGLFRELVGDPIAWPPLAQSWKVLDLSPVLASAYGPLTLYGVAAALGLWAYVHGCRLAAGDFQDLD